MPVVLVLLALVLLAPSASAASAHLLTGTWRATPEETPLSSEFDESVWGKNAKAVRTVDLTVKPTGDAALTVTRKILDAHGREIKAATSVEHADLMLGGAEPSKEVRSDLEVTVKRAERRYPDDPSGTWPLEGLRVTVSTFADDPSRIEVRVDTPEGPGSFWETLHRATRQAGPKGPALR